MRSSICANRRPLKNNPGLLRFIVAIAIGCLLECCLDEGCHASSGFDIGRFRHQDLQGGAPASWQLQLYKGTPALAIEQDGRQTFLRMSAGGKTAFGVKKAVSVDVRTYPFLHWKWKAYRLPDGGDIRRADRDDQALQLYVVFPAMGFPAVHTSPTIAYVWDNDAPKGLITTSPQKLLGYVRYVVLRNKTDSLGIAQMETRNVYEDYGKLFGEFNGGKPSGPIRAVLLFINTHHTRSAAEGSVGDIYFSRTEK